MHLVSDNDPKEIEKRKTELEKQRAESEIRWALIALTANLMRVSRGAGRSYDIFTHAYRFIEGVVGYNKSFGHLPSDFLYHEAVSLDQNEDFLEHISDDARTEYEAQKLIVRGSLQFAASKLLRQGTQQRAGEREMSDGRRALDDARAERLRAYKQSLNQKPPRAKPKKPIPL